jgi:hypothetical protein
MEEVDTRNAVNLEESEDEDELEDIIEDFATQTIEEENAVRRSCSLTELS